MILSKLNQIKIILKEQPVIRHVVVLRLKIKNFKNLINVYVYDCCRFKKYYSDHTVKLEDKSSLEAWLLQDKHRIEKGLSLPNPRFNFGVEPIKRLIKNLESYSELYDKDEVYYISVGALKAYRQFHCEHNVSLNDNIKTEFHKIADQDFSHELCNRVGINDVFQVEDKSETFKELVFSRSSCRNYTNRIIPEEILKSVVEMSVKTPSVCNRQHWRLHVFSDETKERLLSLQNGNAGFSDNIPYLAIITSDLKAFYRPEERFQPYTDAGMFSMSLIYALHSYGISSCALNWCTLPRINEALYEISGIDRS
ncbi:hypothetical protein BCT61_17300, partial [Vibrio breoganii]|uniref:nitroreductase family protein n=1 Tax=Vibrio breoganii TaxID=553239 RepID=UPI000C83FDE0